jgi:hypothetical protein
MNYPIEIVLRGMTHAVTETLVHQAAPLAWTDDDVRDVLREILLAIDRVKNPGATAPPVTLRGFSWIVEPMDGQVIIALEIPMGVAVAGPFDIERERLDAMIARVVAASARTATGPTVH